MPSAVSAGHQSIRLRLRGPPLRVSSQIAATGITAKLAVALTPPTMATASADSAAARRGEPRDAPTTSGSSTQGASAEGQASIEMVPTVVSMRGESAYANPATRHARWERRRARARRTPCR